MSILVEASSCDKEKVAAACSELGWTPLDCLCYALACDPEHALPIGEFPLLAYVPPLRRVIVARLEQVGSRLKEMQKSTEGMGIFAIDADRGVVRCKYCEQELEVAALEDGDEVKINKNWSFHAVLEFPSKGEFINLMTKFLQLMPAAPEVESQWSIDPKLFEGFMLETPGKASGSEPGSVKSIQAAATSSTGSRLVASVEPS
eukprot:6461868-Amphidinium_carterae.3